MVFMKIRDVCNTFTVASAASATAPARTAYLAVWCEGENGVGKRSRKQMRRDVSPKVQSVLRRPELL